MGANAGTGPGLRLFSREDAPLVDDTPMLRPPALDQAALDALPEFRTGAGSVTKLLYGDPDDPDGGGPSLVWVRFKPGYHLPRHSHSVDCVYYIISGAIRLGRRSLGPGEGFFVSADQPYSYVAGDEGVELLEFRSVSSFDSRIRETAEGWSRILQAVRANRSRWAATNAESSETEALLQRYLKAQEEHDLEALVSCWHPDVEVVHPMRPDRNWSGLDTYRRQWALIWARRPSSRFEVVTADVVRNRIYLEALTEMSDGTMVPHMNVLEIKEGKIFRATVYTDKPQRDGVSIDGYADAINPSARGESRTITGDGRP